MGIDEKEMLIKLETRVEGHNTRIVRLEDKTNAIHNDLKELKSVLVNIKWWLIGVGSFYLLEQMGLAEVVKHIIKGML